MASPYRDGKTIDALIPPDHRRRNAVLLVCGGLAVGALVTTIGYADCRPPVTRWTPLINAAPGPGAISDDELRMIVSANTPALRATCFEPRSDLESARVDLDLAIGKDGEVQSSSFQGTDGKVTACVDKEVRAWRFPGHEKARPSAHIPLYFDRT